MIHFKSIFSYSLKDSLIATWHLIKLKLTPKKYSFITANALEKKLAHNEELTIIDCRAPKVFAGIGHIKGAINIPVTKFDEECGKVPHDKPIVVVCYFGFFSQIASQKLAELGHKHVKSMKGGMEKWIMSGKPTVTAEKKPDN